MRLSVACAVLACSLGGLLGCGERPAPPPPPEKPSSSWTPRDSQAVAKELMDTASHAEWAISFRNHSNRLPRVMVGEITDKSGDHVDIADLTSQLEKELYQSQQVGVVKSVDSADFVLKGVINREPVAGGSRFPVDLRLVTTDGDPVWIGGIERSVAKLPDPQ